MMVTMMATALLRRVGVRAGGAVYGCLARDASRRLSSARRTMQTEAVQEVGDTVKGWRIPCGEMNVVALPVLSNNYTYVLTHKRSPDEVVAVDSGDAEPLLTYCKENSLRLTQLLTTHHHYDHCDGNPAIVEAFPGIPVLGADLRIQNLTHAVRPGQSFKLFDGHATVQVIGAAGHTTNQVAFYITAPDSTPLLFSGDSIFSAGCGRLFEGTPEIMFDTMARIRALPDDTLLFPGHEMTLSNLEFALAYAQENGDGPCRLHDIQQHHRTCTLLRQDNRPTVPTTLRAEHTFNLFFAARSPEELGVIRAAKDAY